MDNKNISSLKYQDIEKSLALNLPMDDGITENEILKLIDDLPQSIRQDILQEDIFSFFLTKLGTPKKRILKKELLFGIIGFLFVIEAVSVILQVCSYKLRKKRIFLMAPIHHHFEKLGWTETKVVRVFWLASIMFAGIGCLSFFKF